MKKTYIAFLIGIISILLNSCSSSREPLYGLDYPLTAEYVKSFSTDLKVQIPQGWFYVEENKNHSIDLWLLRDDMGAAIVFTPIHMDESTLNEIRESETNGLSFALNFSKTLRKAMNGSGFKQLQDDEYFEINNTPYAAYRYTGKSGIPSRVILFRYAGYFYEAAASINNSSSASTEFEQLFRVQNAVLSSLR